ncbi:hypothetical protein [Halococcus sp. AFM35]|uniref:hypothetical protein n=1 Tax=Halococcus sp. AFM35 TaxID=3421653 RepID=UPI003EBF79F3
MATETVTSEWQQITDGDTTTVDIPEGRDISGGRVRWRGDTDPAHDTERTYSNSAAKSGEGYVDVQTNFPDVSGEFVRCVYDLSATAGGEPVTVYEQMGTSTSFTVPAGETEYYRESTTTDLRGRAEGAFSDSPPYKYIALDLRTVISERVPAVDTQDPSVSLSGQATTGPTSIDDGDVTAWVPLSGLANGSNTLTHSIEGSNEAEFQLEYSYTTTEASPVAATLEPTTAAGTATAMEAAAPVAASLRPTTATGEHDASGGWRATLETADGDETHLDADELLSVDISTEHTAAWGGTIECPPIIDPDDYRGGRLLLRYGAVLQLRCPTITKREQADDGTVTISALGPASLLKDTPVDTEFADVFVHRAIRALLLSHGNAGLANIAVRPPPDSRVESERVQFADSRNAFADILERRSRSASGQYQSESGGEAPDWLPTDPLTFTESGGITTLQSCVPSEGEAFDRADSSTDTSDVGANATASGGSVLSIHGSATFVEYDFGFDYEIPEGSFAIGIRAQSVATDTNATGTTTIRVSAGETELFSFEAGDHGDTMGWQQHMTDFQPGTDGHSLRLEVAQSGERELALDCLAVYDNRYSYTFGGGVDSDGALPGPELHPDAAEVMFADAPAGIALDEASVAVTMDQPGEADRAGVVFTSIDESSSSAIAGIEATHTASTDATTTNLRPTVAISRYSDGRTETPTQGNQPQVLESIETTVSGNAVPIIESRSFDETSVFDAVQTLCNDYGFNWVVEHGRPGGIDITVFKRGDPEMRRPLPDDAVVLDASESAAAQDYKNAVTVVGAEVDGERVSWTEENRLEIEQFGREPLRLENDELTTVNDCRSVARSELASRLDEDERGGKLSITPSLIPPGYPYRIEAWEDTEVVGWGDFAWGQQPWGSPAIYATLETSGLSESAGSADSELDFDVRSDIIAAFAGGL